MAEAVGLVIGSVSLAALFTTCIDFMDFVDLGRNHGKDFEVALTKLLLLRSRLHAWGESLNIPQQGQELPILRKSWPREKDAIGRGLVGIKQAFEETDAFEKT